MVLSCNEPSKSNVIDPFTINVGKFATYGSRLTAFSITESDLVFSSTSVPTIREFLMVIFLSRAIDHVNSIGVGRAVRIVRGR